ncbi:hypothetical protein Ancab_008917 [Ancistrocladus abbreviatus]
MESIVGRKGEEEMLEGVDLQTRRSSHRNRHTLASNAAYLTSDDNAGNLGSGRDGVEAESYSVNEKEAEVEGADGLDDEKDFEGLKEIAKGAESGNEFSCTDNNAVSCPLPNINAGDDEVDLAKKHISTLKNSDPRIDDECVENLKQNELTSFNNLLPSISKQQQGGTSKAFCNVERKHEEVGVDVYGVTIAELDVERVLEKQETHDLFCPNCNSCITKRVILRRKREAPDNEDPIVLSDDEDPEIEPPSVRPFIGKKWPVIFRCLSCLSIFIPEPPDTPINAGVQQDKDGQISFAQGGPTGHASTNSGIEDATHTGPVKPQEGIIQLPVQKPPLPIQPDGQSVTIPIPIPIPGPTPGVDPIEPDRPPGLDILKAIVYGGLIESITSLSVVTSAVGADATTLNVLAMGVANVIGGLFIIAHNLIALKQETSIQRYEEQLVQRYEEQLGQTRHFRFHATIAVISYLIFGLMPPIVYSFSFRESNNRYLKLAALASSALLCIFLLAIGKAYIRTPPKSYIKTITYYVGSGIMVSGASFIVGDLVQALLEKLGLFQSSYTVLIPVSKGASPKMVWTS